MADSPPADPESSRGSPLKGSASRAKSPSPLLPTVWWGVLLLPTLVLSAGAGLWAVKNLLELPNLPHCRSASRTQDTPSERVYCAEQLADGKRVQDLRQAILLVSDIPQSDPLHNESQRLIEQWSRAILELGETDFQAGDLAAAVKIAGAIPSTVHTYSLAEERIEHWHSIWDRAKAVYQQAEEEVSQRKWSDAINTAKALLTVGNQHWSTTKHQELMKLVQASKEAQALQAKLQEKTPIRRSSTQAPDSFDEYFTRRDREREKEAESQLAEAWRLASAGSVGTLQAAIDTASQILYGTPHYEAAQEAIDGWRSQIEILEDQPHLERARTLASQGDLESIEAAIAEARQIGWGRPLYQEAYTSIEQWRDRAYQLRIQRQTEQLENPNNTPAIETYPVQPTSLQSSPPDTGEMGRINEN